MEGWDIGMLILAGTFKLTNSTVKISLASKTISQSHFPRAHYSIIPVFQYSNWGEAPKL
jgi:hypothetical protein